MRYNAGYTQEAIFVAHQRPEIPQRTVRVWLTSSCVFLECELPLAAAN
jgi:hypothetical protein